MAIEIVKDSNDEYHSHDSISASGLKKIAEDWSIENFLIAKYEESEAMKLGTAIHAAFLEPETFYDIY
jgi:hypothetical protein